MYPYATRQTGDILIAHLPSHLNKGQPGDASRLCLVLGLEVSGVNDLNGLWLVRLSERLEKVRSWDHRLTQKEIVNKAAAECLSRDYIIRTPRIDLVPATPDYVGDMQVLGHVTPAFWDRFLPQLVLGQASGLNTGSYGPRGPLDGSFVKTSLMGEDCFAVFDAETIVQSVMLPPIGRDFGDHADIFAMAARQQRAQDKMLSRLIHEDFRTACRSGRGWDWPTYKATCLPARQAQSLDL